MRTHLKAIAGILAGTLLLPVLPLCASAEQQYQESGIWAIREYEDGTVSVSLNDKEAESVDVPEQIEGKTVTMIEVDCFNGCENLKTVTLPPTITVIEDYSFYGCTSLEAITIPDSVVNIGMKAFCGCAAIEEVSIPAGLTEIEEFAFEGCASLRGVHVAPANPSYLDEDGILFNKDKTTLILYPSAIEDEHYEMPDGCTTIEDYAFIGNTHLKTIGMEHVTSIGTDAFYYCTSLETAAVPDGIETLNGSVFGNCTSLQTVELPDGLTEIGESCFYACMSLREIEIPETVTSIRDYAFFNCPMLKTIRLTKNTTEIGKYSLGYYYSSGDEPTRVPGFVVDAADDTAAFTYCAENSIKCTGGVTQGSVFIVIIVCVIALVIIATVILIILQKRNQKLHELN